ncbi:MAG: hypothetical protein ACREXP_10800 [Steroidobacteraceae bacterium]
MNRQIFGLAGVPYAERPKIEDIVAANRDDRTIQQRAIDDARANTKRQLEESRDYVAMLEGLTSRQAKAQLIRAKQRLAELEAAVSAASVRR